MKVKYLSLLVVVLALVSCDTNRVYEMHKPIGTKFWYVDSVAEFGFEIKDTAQLYDVSSAFTYASDFKNYNLYYRYWISDSTGVPIVENLQNINLFDPKTGQPMGAGLGDVFDLTQPVLEGFSFRKSGKYWLHLQQYMRMDSLAGIESTGAIVRLHTEEK